MAESTFPTNTNNKLAGKVAIVTGGASGIGEETVQIFANHGTRMVIVADIQDEIGQQISTSIGAHKCTYKHCDVTNEEQVKSLVEWTVQNFGQLDIMFSNAGIFGNSDQTILELDLPTFDHMFAINVRGMATCVKYAARAMVEGRVRGSIVCTASVRGSSGAMKHTDYTISKHAVIGLMRAASVQLGVHGIRVNSVSPFGLATPLTCHAYGLSVGELEDMYGQYLCLKGVVLRKRHVAEAVLFLASNDSELITGHDLVVDGGYLIGRGNNPETK